MVVDGEPWWLLGDDAMISLRYAQHLARGDGPVFNVGERVEGFTNPLWMAWMAVGFVLGLPERASALPALVVAVASAAALALVTKSLARRLGAPPAAAFAAGLVVALNADVARWGAQGFETVPLALAVAVAASGVVADAPRERLTAGTLAALSVLSWLRSDGVVLAGLLLAAAVAPSPRALAGRVWVPLVAPAALTLLRLAYFHDVVPNTAHLKVFDGAARIAFGARYLRSAVTASPGLFLATAATLALGGRAARVTAAIALAWCAWVLWIGGDAFPGRRFIVPVMPLMVAASAASLSALPAAGWARAFALATALCLTPLRLPGLRDPWVPPVDAIEADNLRVGLWVARNTPLDATLADQWAGTTLFVSGRRGVDLLGKVDAFVARHAPVYAGPAPGHNRWDLDWSLGVRRPDYVVAPTHLPLSRDIAASLRRPSLLFARALLEDPYFVAHCRPHLMPTNTWRTVLRCEWATPAQTAPVR